MTIFSFCHAQLMTDGPLASEELAARAVAAGVTRAANPLSSVVSALRYQGLQLLDGRWVAPLQLLEGRCLTAARLPRRFHLTDEEPDFALLGTSAADLGGDVPSVLAPGQVLCLRVSGGTVGISTIAEPDPLSSEVAALAERLPVPPSKSWYGEQRRSALRAVAQLMADDPSTFRSPLPRLSTWVPALVEDAREQQRQVEQYEEYEREQERRRRREVVLDDDRAWQVALAAARAGVPIRCWVEDVIDAALAAERGRQHEPDRVVISLLDRRGAGASSEPLPGFPASW